MMFRRSLSSASSSVNSPASISFCISDWSFVICVATPSRIRYARLSPTCARYSVSLSSAAIVAVVPMPRSSGLLTACWKIDQLAFSAAWVSSAASSSGVTTRLPENFSRRCRSTTHAVGDHEQRRRGVGRLFYQSVKPERLTLAQVHDDVRVLVMLSRAAHVRLRVRLHHDRSLGTIASPPGPGWDHVFP